MCRAPCTSWAHVFQHSEYGGYKDRNAEQGKRWSLIKPPTPHHRPGWQTSVTIKQISKKDLRNYYLCVDMALAQDRCCQFRLEVEDRTKHKATREPDPALTIVIPEEQAIKIIPIKDLKKSLEIETRYADENARLEWMRYTTKTLGRTDCHACASAKPQLIPTPFPLNFSNSPEGVTCMLSLFTEEGSTKE